MGDEVPQLSERGQPAVPVLLPGHTAQEVSQAGLLRVSHASVWSGGRTHTTDTHNTETKVDFLLAVDLSGECFDADLKEA